MNEDTRISEDDLLNLSLDDLEKVVTAIKIEMGKYFKMEGPSNTISASYNTFLDFHGSPVVKTPHSQCRRHGFDSWSGN